MADVYADAAAGAMADIAAANAAPSTPEAPAVPASTPAAPEAQATPPEAPPAPEVRETPSTDTADPSTPPVTEEETGQQKWVFSRKGQQVEITDPNQAAELIRKGYDYTEKTMELAEQRRLFEAQKAQTIEWLKNPANLRQVLGQIDPTFRQTPSPSPSPATPEPDDLVTQAQAQQLAQAQLAAAQQYAATTVQQAILQAETARYTQEYTGEVDRTLHNLFEEKHPILKSVEGMDKLIRDEVGQVVRSRVVEHPEEVVSIDEVKTLLVQTAQKRAAALQKQIDNHLKMTAVRAAKVTKNGIEPPGAPPPAPAPTKQHKLGSAELTAAVIAELQAAFDAKS